jgi:MoaA/NifB/PqqE/SkfB family radical SAM enzyme
MYCPRLDHFVRFNPTGTVSRCGHMVNAPQFNSLEEMNSSDWLKQIKNRFSQDRWPLECSRCEKTESVNGTSIRLNSIKVDNQETLKNYLQVGGVLDNVCNSACQMCNENLSTKIGKLKSKIYPIINNADKFWNLPQDSIIHLDINGGEPSASPNYKRLLENLPPNLKTLRVNTNCTIMLPILKEINSRGINVTVTVSFDGVGSVHDYVRWPIKWKKFYKNLLEYKSYGLSNLNLWTTVNVLNINDLENILNFVKQHNFNHSFAMLERPSVLSIHHTNQFTTKAKQKFNESKDVQLNKLADFIAIGLNNQCDLEKFIRDQDQLRGINISNFIK